MSYHQFGHRSSSIKQSKPVCSCMSALSVFELLELERHSSRDLDSSRFGR